MANNFTQYHFDGQKKDENIFLVLHRHWFDIFSQFVIIFFMLAIFLGSFIFSFFFFDFFLNDPEMENVLDFIRSLLLIFTWITFFLILIDYYFDIWIVTDKRIVNIEQKGMFSRVVSELKLENIQDITTDVKGIIPTFLNYGNLHVQTAAEKERFNFRSIPNPYKVKNLIMNLQKKSEQKEENEFGELIRKKVHNDGS
jgi:uncharacterized membrane protein YdbT with pleckstrin-like domain